MDVNMHDNHYIDDDFGPNLDDRRPRKLADIVGQDHIVPRLRQAAKNGKLSNRYLITGPTGVGKTTLAQVIARLFWCPRGKELGRLCGKCQTCVMEDLNGFSPYREIPGAHLNEYWDWWQYNEKSALDRAGWCVFIDEAQDLCEKRQKAFYRQLEEARAMVIFATTHEHKLIDALVGRFGLNKFELRRPTNAEVVECMMRHCVRLGVIATSEQLSFVAVHLCENLRLCVDFVYTVQAQSPDAHVTEEVIESILGVSPSMSSVATTRRRARL